MATKVLLAPLDELLGRHRDIGVEDHRSVDFLRVVIVVDPYNGHLNDRRVSREHFLDFSGVHVVAAPDDHFLLTIDDEEEAVLICIAEVTRSKPSVDNDLGGCLGPIQIALEETVPADNDFTDLASGQGDDVMFLIMLGDRNIDSPDPLSDRTNLSSERHVVERDDGTRLGESITLPDGNTEDLLESLQCDDIDGCSPADSEAKRSRDVLGYGLLQECKEHGRYAREIRHGVLVHQFEGKCLIETLHQNDGRTNAEGRVHDCRLTECMEERQGCKRNVVARDEQRVLRHDMGVPEKTLMGQHGTFRLSRGTRRVQHDRLMPRITQDRLRKIFPTERSRTCVDRLGNSLQALVINDPNLRARTFCGLLRSGRHGLRNNDHSAICISQDVLNFRRHKQCMDRDDCGTQCRYCKIGEDELRCIRHQQRDAIAPLHTLGSKFLSEPEGRQLHVPIRPDSPFRNQRLAIREPRCRLVQELRETDVGSQRMSLPRP